MRHSLCESLKLARLVGGLAAGLYAAVRLPTTPAARIPANNMYYRISIIRLIDYMCSADKKIMDSAVFIVS